jgi:hypothetical protein
VEPNETIAQANPISTPGLKTGSAKVGDAAVFEFVYGGGQRDKIEDFFTFSIPTNQSRTLDITLTFNNPAADLDLLLFKLVNNNLSAIAVSNGSTTTERITPILTLGEGAYFIGVSAFDDPGNTASANYTLSVVPDGTVPPPTISSIVPQSVSAGSELSSITVNGTNYISGQSVVRWNGQSRTTTYINERQLVAFISAADTASPGTNLVTVFNPPSLGGTSAAVPFTVVPQGTPEPEVEPNETSEQATLLLAPGKRSGSVALGDAALTIINLNNGLSDPVEDLFAVTIGQSSRLDLKLTGSNSNANLALYLLRETDNQGNFTVIGNSRFAGPAQRITTPAPLAPGRYLVGVSAVTGSSPYVIEALIPGNRLLAVRTSSAAPNSIVTVPISFLADGNESLFNFSLGYNTAVLSNPQVSVGVDTVNAALNVNNSQTAQGRVGVRLNLPQGQSINAGDREIAKVKFAIAPNPASGATRIEFADDPVVRGLADNNGNSLIGSYANGTVIVVPGFEADVSPRPLGNNAVTIADWTQVGRFAAGLDSTSDGSEYQRADVAPKSSLGDGRLSIADWVMAGRYAAGLETILAAGGPVEPASAVAAASSKTGSLAADDQQQTRTIRVIPATFNRGLDNTLAVELNSLGNENAVGFSLNFDASQFTFVRATLGSDATGAILNINNSQIAQGRVGIGIALPSGQTFQAGAKQIVTVTFTVPQMSSLNSTTVSFGDQPIQREVVDVSANVLAATYTPGVITLNPQISATPTLTSLNPSTVIVGGPSFTLTVIGTNFVTGALVRVNGVDRATQFVSSTELRATILAQDIAETGAIAITVRNPEPTNGTSNALNLSIVNPVPVLTSISPESAAVGSLALTLMVNGTNFVPGAVVQWNGANRITTFVNSALLTAQIPASDLSTAGTATLRAINPGPGGGQSNSLNFTVASPSPIPRITSIAPETIQAGSAGFTLTVNGNNYVSASVVRFNGNPLPTTFVSATQLTAQVSAADIANPGNAVITVFNPAPGGGMSNGAILVVSVQPNPVPVITAINPATVTAGGAQFTLTVTGSNFVQNSVVRFNGQNRATTFVSATEIRATITAGDIINGGMAAITVFNPAPAGGTSNAVQLTITFAPPAITFLSPTSAVAGGPAFQLTVIGTNFAPGSVVRWNGEDRTTNFLGVTELVAQIPASDIANVGAAQITVFSPSPGGGLSNAVTFNINQAARPLPRITTISPDNGLAGGPAFTLTVNGQNFVSDSVVRWNGAARPTTFVNSTQLTAAIPASDIAATGSASVTVFTPPAGGGESNAAIFTINTPPTQAPAITSISPSTVSAGGAAFVLTVNGSNFVPASVVQLNGTNRPTTFVNTGQLTAQISADDIAGAGTASIRVFTPPPGGGTSNELMLTIVNPAPAITSINPNVVADGGSAFTLTVTGTNFVAGAQILINNSPRVTTFVSSTQLTTTIAAADIANPGTVSVQVVNPPPGGGSSNTVQLEVRRRNPLPRLTSISPTSVPAAGPGFVLIVTGSSFVQSSVVRVNGEDRQTDFVSESSLAAQIPASDIATGGVLAITVFNPAPGGGMSNAINLNITNPVPRITSISPEAAAAGSPAITMIVNGFGFVSGSIVRFAGVDIPTTFITGSQLSSVIPASLLTGGASVSVTVFNPAPGGGSSSAVTFSITNPPPVIASLNPAQVLAAGPQFTLTVQGSGFVSGSVVRVNGQGRQTTFVSSTQVTATILASDIATGGPLNITVMNPPPGGGESAASTLTVLNPVPTISSLNPNTIAAGSAAFELSVNGSGFVQGATVSWNGTPRQTTFVSSTELRAAVTAADVANPGAATINVSNPAPGGGASNTLIFTISAQPNPAPVLTSLNPASVPAGNAAFTLTVNGANFVPGAVVQWNGSDRTTAFVSSTQLTAQITAQDVANQGTASIVAVNPAPGGGPSNALIFNITPPNPAPSLTSLTPNTAAIGSPAFTLTVQGAGFVPGSVVRWNGADRQTTFFSATQLFAQIPASDLTTAGTANVTVFNPAPGGGTSNSLTFAVVVQPNPVPTIATLSPGTAIAGDDPFTLVVTGSNFVAGSVVQWNGAARPTVVVSVTELRAQISAEDVSSPGEAVITVFNPAPGGGLSNALTFVTNALNCRTVCFRSPAYYLFNINRLPRGSVLIGGVNFNVPVSIQSSLQDVRRALEGGMSPLQMLNQQHVATQLSIIIADGPVTTTGLLNSSLRCFNLSFAPMELSNGFTLSRNTTIGDLLAQVRSSITDNRTNDMTRIAMVLALLNGEDMSNSCR